MSAKDRRKNISGYLLNQTEKGICLIPINAEFRKNTIDIEHYIIINQNDIKEVKIKSQEILYIKIQILLKDGTKYIMTTNKKIRSMPMHGENVAKFVKIYKKQKQWKNLLTFTLKYCIVIMYNKYFICANILRIYKTSLQSIIVLQKEDLT